MGELGIVRRVCLGIWWLFWRIIWLVFVKIMSGFLGKLRRFCRSCLRRFKEIFCWRRRRWFGISCVIGWCLGGYCGWIFCFLLGWLVGSWLIFLFVRREKRLKRWVYCFRNFFLFVVCFGRNDRFLKFLRL